MKLSKKGQGVGLIAVIVMLALLYFIFRYNTQAFDFVMTAGDAQAHLVTSFTEVEKAKYFAKDAFRQAFYETAWKAGARTCDDFKSKVCSNQTLFLSNVSNVFDNYIQMYAPSSELLSVNFPAYVFESKSCADKEIKIDAFGYLESCYLKSEFAFPQFPCEDQLYETDCKKIKFTNKNPNACKWNSADAVCEYANPEPDCESARTQAACDAVVDSFRNKACTWKVSYSEDISVLSIPLVDYQFKINSDAHFIETIDCKGFNAFADSRKIAFKPVCILSVQPDKGNKSVDFKFSIDYKGDGEPKEINLVITNSTNAEIVKAALNDLTVVDKEDANYLDGKLYAYSKKFMAENYTAEVTCKDPYDNSASSTKSFEVA
ncbi:MAG: hypothetical protein QXH80_00730 [Candidatus Nanoarchaeia archaeon]